MSAWQLAGRPHRSRLRKMKWQGGQGQPQQKWKGRESIDRLKHALQYTIIYYAMLCLITALILMDPSAQLANLFR